MTATSGPTSGDTGRPPTTASKAELLDYAERQGLSRVALEGQSKDDINAQLDAKQTSQQQEQGGTPSV